MNYDVIRSSRKSISISISPENRIIVRCPRYLSDDKVTEYVEGKRVWIENTIYKNSIRLSENSQIIGYKKIYVAGVMLPLVFSDKNEITENAVYIKCLKDIKKTFIRCLKNEFVLRIRNISENTGLNFNNIAFKYYKSRWGCCDRNGNAIFNCLLLMLPIEIQSYVIIHELCHTVYFNHSRAFWSTVKKYDPGYKQMRAKLKDFNFITNLYK